MTQVHELISKLSLVVSNENEKETLKQKRNILIQLTSLCQYDAIKKQMSTTSTLLDPILSCVMHYHHQQEEEEEDDAIEIVLHGIELIWTLSMENTHTFRLNLYQRGLFEWIYEWIQKNYHISTSNSHKEMKQQQQEEIEVPKTRRKHRKTRQKKLLLVLLNLIKMFLPHFMTHTTNSNITTKTMVHLLCGLVFLKKKKQEQTVEEEEEEADGSTLEAICMVLLTWIQMETTSTQSHSHSISQLILLREEAFLHRLMDTLSQKKKNTSIVKPNTIYQFIQFMDALMEEEPIKMTKFLMSNDILLICSTSLQAHRNGHSNQQQQPEQEEDMYRSIVSFLYRLSQNCQVYGQMIQQDFLLTNLFHVLDKYGPFDLEMGACICQLLQGISDFARTCRLDLLPYLIKVSTSSKKALLLTAQSHLQTTTGIQQQQQQQQIPYGTSSSTMSQSTTIILAVFKFYANLSQNPPPPGGPSISTGMDAQADPMDVWINMEVLEQMLALYISSGGSGFLNQLSDSLIQVLGALSRTSIEKMTDLQNEDQTLPSLFLCLRNRTNSSTNIRVMYQIFAILNRYWRLQRQKTRDGERGGQQQKSAYAISGFTSLCMNYLMTFVVNRGGIGGLVGGGEGKGGAEVSSNELNTLMEVVNFLREVLNSRDGQEVVFTCQGTATTTSTSNIGGRGLLQALNQIREAIHTTFTLSSNKSNGPLSKSLSDGASIGANLMSFSTMSLHTDVDKMLGIVIDLLTRMVTSTNLAHHRNSSPTRSLLHGQFTGTITSGGSSTRSLLVPFDQQNPMKAQGIGPASGGGGNAGGEGDREYDAYVCKILRKEGSFLFRSILPAPTAATTATTATFLGSSQSKSQLSSLQTKHRIINRHADRKREDNVEEDQSSGNEDDEDHEGDKDEGDDEEEEEDEDNDEEEEEEEDNDEEESEQDPVKALDENADDGSNSDEEDEGFKLSKGKEASVIVDDAFIVDPVTHRPRSSNRNHFLIEIGNSKKLIDVGELKDNEFYYEDTKNNIKYPKHPLKHLEMEEGEGNQRKTLVMSSPNFKEPCTPMREDELFFCIEEATRRRNAFLQAPVDTRARLVYENKMVYSSSSTASIDTTNSNHHSMMDPVYPYEISSTNETIVGPKFDVREEDEDFSPGPTIRSNSLTFDSNFESGNLQSAIQIGDFEYDLILQRDVNTNGHMQWFYFAISNIGCTGTGINTGTEKEMGSNTKIPVKYRFHIVNLCKPDSLFNQGLQPVVYSVKEASVNQRGWLRSGGDICYYPNPFSRSKSTTTATTNDDDDSRTASSSKTEQYFFTLSFTLTFENQDDTYLIAHSYPYTVMDHEIHIERLLNTGTNTKKIIEKNILCTTLSGRSCDLLTITDFESPEEERRRRRVIIFTSRVHPGEPQASWMMKGLLDFLLDPKDLIAILLRRLFIFQVIPILNPDGVALGNSRCGLSCCDLNRQWLVPNVLIHPEIFYTKQMIQNQIDKNGVLLFCDLHGHSRKKNVFFYGCDTLKRKNPRAREFVKQICFACPQFYDFKGCTFGISKDKETTARVVVSKEMKLSWSFTLEASFCGTEKNHFSIQDLEKIGQVLGKKVLDICIPNLELRDRLLELIYQQDTTSQQINFAKNIESQLKEIGALQGAGLVGGGKKKKTTEQSIVVRKKKSSTTTSSSTTTNSEKTTKKKKNKKSVLSSTSKKTGELPPPPLHRKSLTQKQQKTTKKEIKEKKTSTKTNVNTATTTISSSSMTPTPTMSTTNSSIETTPVGSNRSIHEDFEDDEEEEIQAEEEAEEAKHTTPSRSSLPTCNSSSTSTTCMGSFRLKLVELTRLQKSEEEQREEEDEEEDEEENDDEEEEDEDAGDEEEEEHAVSPKKKKGTLKKKLKKKTKSKRIKKKKKDATSSSPSKHKTLKKTKKKKTKASTRKKKLKTSGLEEEDEEEQEEEEEEEDVPSTPPSREGSTYHPRISIGSTSNHCVLSSSSSSSDQGQLLPPFHSPSSTMMTIMPRIHQVPTASMNDTVESISHQHVSPPSLHVQASTVKNSGGMRNYGEEIGLGAGGEGGHGSGTTTTSKILPPTRVPSLSPKLKTGQLLHFRGAGRQYIAVQQPTDSGENLQELMKLQRAGNGGQFHSLSSTTLSLFPVNLQYQHHHHDPSLQSRDLTLPEQSQQQEQQQQEDYSTSFSSPLSISKKVRPSTQAGRGILPKFYE